MSDLDRCTTEVIKVNDRKEAKSKSWCLFKKVVSSGELGSESEFCFYIIGHYKTVFQCFSVRQVHIFWYGGKVFRKCTAHVKQNCPTSKACDYRP